MAVYISEPDRTGHDYGPDAQEMNDTLSMLDNLVGRLWEGLQEREISECVNLIIMSDHGMDGVNESKVVNISSVSGWEEQHGIHDKFDVWFQYFSSCCRQILVHQVCLHIPVQGLP